MAGQYEPHYDMKTLHDINVQNAPPSEIGNRVATFLAYLGEPVGGGATIFTEAGVRLSPIKVGCAGRRAGTAARTKSRSLG